MMYILQHRETTAYVKDISVYDSGNYVVYTTYREKALRFASYIIAQQWARKLKCYIAEVNEDEHQ